MYRLALRARATHQPARAVDRERRQQREARVQTLENALAPVERPEGVQVARPLVRLVLAQALAGLL